ncbi:hypothetical protein YJ28_26230, partial [Salmonella enterica subsp. enterica]|nr:hypothetical protein [Salmonella enterica subsp. enterica serovar Bovismorbificans]
QPDLFEKAFDLWQHSQDIGQQQAVTNLLEKNVQVIAKQLEAHPIIVKQLFTLFDSPQRKIEISSIYTLMANTRSTALAPDLIQRYVTKHDERAEIVKTMTKISGFDQVIDDFCDDYVDKKWLERQYPRHVEVLSNLAQLLLQYTDYQRFINLLD